MTENKKLQKVFIIGGASIFVLCVIAWVVVVVGIRDTKKTISELLQDNVAVQLSQAVDRMNLQFQKVRAGAEILGALETEPEYLPAEELQTLLTTVTGNCGAYRSCYVDLAGLGSDDTGNEIDLSGADYFPELAGMSDGFLRATNDGFTSKGAIVYLKAVGESGYFLVFVDKKVFDQVLTDLAMEEYLFYALIDQSHAMILSGGAYSQSGFLYGDLWNNLKDHSVTADWYIFSQRIGSAREAELDATKDKESIHIFSVPVENTDWTLMVGLSPEYAEGYMVEMSAGYERTRVAVFLLLLMVVLTYLTLCLIIAHQTRERARELGDKADTDQLTGLSNKVATELLIKDYMAKNPGSQAVFILIDVDNFKKINDTMGHAFGDEVLRNLGIRLRSLYRMNDIIGRLGGDEFCVFLKDIRDEEIIRREAGKLLTFFRDFEVGEYVKYSVTGSLGAAIFPREGASFEDLYKNADTALYAAKHGGKNQLIFYADTRETHEKSE
ncbi:MAG: GGDEF domain-containing protein [Lachnospiraceae bacterium]|nr:GGDEF domain-containing protein [Lachnospiraceae bacterium]